MKVIIWEIKKQTIQTNKFKIIMIMKTTKFFGMMLFALALAFTGCSNAEDPIVDPIVDPVTGLGTEVSPFTVAQGITGQATTKWVKGYIVGYAWSATVGTNFFFIADTCSQATNMLIADSKTETDAAKCLIVQLPLGALRTGLNLKDVKVNIGKEVTLYGSLEAYFSKPGLKSPTYYALTNGTTGGTKPIDITGAIFSETFAASIGNFTNQSIVGGDQVWAFSATYKCAVMSGYINATKLYVPNEDWLISPEIDLSKSTTPKLIFEHVTAYFGDVTNETTVWISENYSSGLPSTATWTQLPTPGFVSASNYTFVSSGELSLAAYTGKKIKISFKYTSSATKAGTWEIKNLVVK